MKTHAGMIPRWWVISNAVDAFTARQARERFCAYALSIVYGDAACTDEVLLRLTLRSSSIRTTRPAMCATTGWSGSAGRAIR